MNAYLIEKRRIQKEEELRFRIQQNLANKRPSRSLRRRLWTFVNSSLGIWFLTTVVLGVGTGVYTVWKANEEREHQRRELIRKLDLEISSRLYDQIMFCQVYRLLNEKQRQVDLVKNLLQPPSVERTLIPEFANRSLRSLLYELSSVVSDNEKEDIIEALDRIEYIERDYSNKELSLDKVEDINSRLTAISARRWSSVVIDRSLRETRFRFEGLLRYIEDQNRKSKQSP